MARRPLYAPPPYYDPYAPPADLFVRPWSAVNRVRHWSRFIVTVNPNVSARRPDGTQDVALNDICGNLLQVTLDTMMQNKQILRRVFKPLTLPPKGPKYRRDPSANAPRDASRAESRDFSGDEFSDEHVFNVSYSVHIETGEVLQRKHANVSIYVLHDSAFHVRTTRDDPDAFAYHFAETWNRLLLTDRRFTAAADPARTQYLIDRLYRHFERPDPERGIEGRMVVSVHASGNSFRMDKAYVGKEDRASIRRLFISPPDAVPYFRGVQRGVPRSIDADLPPATILDPLTPTMD